MEALSPEATALFGSIATVSAAMVDVAKGKRMLEDRHDGRVCPACGRIVNRDGSCGCVE